MIGFKLSRSRMSTVDMLLVLIVFLATAGSLQKCSRKGSGGFPATPQEPPRDFGSPRGALGDPKRFLSLPMGAVSDPVKDLESVNTLGELKQTRSDGEHNWWADRLC